LAEARRLALPDFCAARSVLAVLVIVGLTALVLTVAADQSALGFWTNLARTSFFLVWIGLLGTAILCALRASLARVPVAAAAVLVLAMMAALIALVSEAAWRFGQGDLLRTDMLSDLIPRDHGPFVARNVIVGAIVTALALRYFYVSQQWRLNVEIQARARVLALQARIRPHFLYNSINAVLSLIRSEPRRAERALEDLADLFRVLMADNRTLVPISQELDLVRQYLALETLRLGERLHVRWKTDTMRPDALVPPLVLQPLVENAVYHGIEPSEQGGEIEIDVGVAEGQLLMSLSNPYPGGGRHSAGNKMALVNIRERLQLHFDAEASMRSEVKDGLYKVTIRMPYIGAPA